MRKLQDVFIVFLLRAAFNFPFSYPAATYPGLLVPRQQFLSPFVPLPTLPIPPLGAHTPEAGIEPG